MIETWLLPDGEVLADLSTLAIPKAAQLARVLKAGSLPFAHFVEARRRTSGETVVFDVDVELGQILVHPIRRLERIAVSFDPDDRAIPEVLALRADFPRVPHLMLRHEPLPRSLCLFDEPYADLKARWTAAMLVERVREWLRLTARGELHADDQPLEPILADAGGWIVVPYDVLDRKAAPITITRLEDHAGRIVLLARSAPHGREGETAFATVTLTSSPRQHGIIEHAPRDLASLAALMAESGDDLIGELRRHFKQWLGNERALSLPVVLLVVFPKQRAGGAAIEATDTWAFLTAEPVKKIGESIGLWEQRAGQIGMLLTPDETRRGEGVVVDLLNVVPTLSREAAVRMSGRAPDGVVKVTAVGVGALGSQVVLNAVRGGYGQWTTIDRDLFWPHNSVRHALDGFSIGRPKADTVAITAASVTDGVPPVAAVVADLLDPGERKHLVDEALTTADVILDMSASLAVSRHLAMAPARGRRVSVFLNPSGTDLVVLMEDADRRYRLDALDLQYYRAVYQHGGLSGHLRAFEARVRYGRSCRDVSTRIPQELVGLHAAIATRAIREASSRPNASISVWRADPQLAVALVPIPVHAVHVEQCGAWAISYDESLRLKLQQLRAERLPNETGGILIGAIDVERRTIGLVDTIPSPRDSTEWPTGYIRGCLDLVEPERTIAEATAGQLHYVGEWHSHPDGFDVRPSPDDVKVLAWLTERMALDGLPGVIAIVGDNGLATYVGEPFDAT